MIHPITYQSAGEALAIVQSGQRIFVHGSAHTPTFLLEALAAEAHRLQAVELVSITVFGDVQVDRPAYQGIFHFNSMFVSASLRQAVREGRADYVPVFLSEIPELFKQNILPLDVALFLGEQFGWVHMVSMLLVFAGILLANWKIVRSSFISQQL